jgi:hypothetical protein
MQLVHAVIFLPLVCVALGLRILSKNLLSSLFLFPGNLSLVPEQLVQTHTVNNFLFP